MPNVKSDQVTNITAEPRTLLQPNENGRLYRAYFSVTFAGTESAGDVIQLQKLPKGARVVGGKIIHSDLGTDVNLDIGYEDADDSDTNVDDDAFTATVLDLSSAGSQDFALAVVGDFGRELPAESWLTGTLVDGGSYSASSGTIEGYVDYIPGE